MIYFVTNQPELFNHDLYTIISIEESLKILNSWKVIQYDSETAGSDSHLVKILCIQLGNKAADIQIVVDTITVDILLYKDILENKPIIGQNLKFDLQFLFNYNIIPLKVYDTMIVEQLLYLGYPRYNSNTDEGISFSLQAMAKRYLDIYINKEIRGDIIWRGLDSDVIVYAANDVKYLEDIMELQLIKCREQGCLIGAKLECDFVPVISYMEWCGIKLDIKAWKAKMKRDLANLEEAKNALNEFVINHPDLQEFVYIERQGNLFSGFDTKPKCTVLWSSSAQVIKVAKILGFDTKVKDKVTGENKDSVIEKHLKKQKGINDEFLRLYLGKGEEGDDDYFPGHQGMAKLVSSFGQGHLNAVNPITGRIHTQYRQLGADTGRMSSGSKQNNDDLAKYKGLPIRPSNAQKKKGLGCPYPNMQQLPGDELTRSCFISESNNYWVSCDYSAIESRLGADIYKEQSMIDEFLHGTGDIHSLVASFCFEECRGKTTKEIKEKYSHFRKKAKPVGFFRGNLCKEIYIQ